ncbi:MAG: tyrosine--tRNA ligase [Phycisphaerae bacterium]
MNAARRRQQLEMLLRGCDRVYTPRELEERLATGKRLRVKLGMDPTAPDLTLGHTVVLRKLRQFQDLGHEGVLIIGDYTAMIGDPTGRSKTRRVLSEQQIEANAATYLKQVAKLLDLSDDKLHVRRNSEWLAPMRLADVIKLMSRVTAARMLERDMFARRQEQGKEIFLHELLYPLMQAYDSVVVEADVELGGTDQTFNNLCGRDLQRSAGQPPQIVMVTPILVGTDGKEKMSKSLGNYIAVTDPPGEMFGKIMRIPDTLLGNYLELLTDLSPEEIEKQTDPGKCNPRDSKEMLAQTLITQYHSAQAAAQAAEEFRRVHGGKDRGLPDDVPEFALRADLLVDGKVGPVDLIMACGFERSRSEARRTIAERGIRLNSRTIEDAHTPIPIKSGDILQRGRRRFVRLVIR